MTNIFVYLDFFTILTSQLRGNSTFNCFIDLDWWHYG